MVSDPDYREKDIGLKPIDVNHTFLAWQGWSDRLPCAGWTDDCAAINQNLRDNAVAYLCH